ncbi:MAG: hypothetical protein KA715_08125 [Xanthomonadaceae bacterium]|nr:hypothetical protein [Xanthomonadaceae bacterium]
MALAWGDLARSETKIDLEVTRTVRAGEDTLSLESLSLQDQSPVADPRFSSTDRVVVLLQGKFNKVNEGYILTCLSASVCPHTKIEVRPSDGAFQFYAVMRNTLTEVRLASIDRNGKPEYARYVFKIFGGWVPPNYTRVVEITDRPPSGSMFIGVSAAPITYSESNSSSSFTSVSLTEIALTSTLGYAFRIGDTRTTRWSGQFLTYITVLPVAATYDPPIRFLGLNVRLGYDFMPLGSPWVFSVFTGYYYLGTFVAGSVYGYSQLTGPQFYPAITRNFDRFKSFRMYLKYSPVNGDGGLFAPANRELAVGLSYRTTIGEKRFPLSFNVDISDMTATSTAFENTGTFRSRVYNFGIGFSVDGIFESKK